MIIEVFHTHRHFDAEKALDRMNRAGLMQSGPNFKG